MSAVKLRNINPLGYVDLPLLRREAGPGEGPGHARFEAEGAGCLVPGEVFECPAVLAGRAPSGEPGTTNYDLGEGLLAQVGNYELVTDEPTPLKKKGA